MQNSSFKRKILFIKKDFQFRMIAIILMMGFIFSNTIITLEVFLINNLSEEASKIIFSPENLRIIVPSMIIIELVGFTVMDT